MGYLVAGVATVFLIGGACAGVITLPTTSDSGLVTRPAVIGKGGIPPLLDFENSTERSLAHIMSSDKCGSGFFEVVEHNGEFITCPQATEPTEIGNEVLKRREQDLTNGTLTRFINAMDIFGPSEAEEPL